MIYEWRVYKVAPGKLPMLNERFRKHWAEIFERNGIKLIGFWEAIVGRTSSLYYMVAYDSLAHREECWKSMRSDAEAGKVRDALAKEQGTITEYVDNLLLMPTDYSPLK
jgi:hypothetical protein